jgi:hypothetical protein
MEYRRRIKEADIKGLGTVRLRSLSAGFWLRVHEINSGPDGDKAKGIRISAEAIASSWVDEKGAPVLAGPEAAIDELELDYFNAISEKIIELYGPQSRAEDATKNS